MQLLPHLDQAVIPIEKLRDYALDPDHRRGGSKARAFKEILGIERRHAEVLAEILKSSLPRSLAQPGAGDKYGQRWMTFGEIVGLNGQSAVVTAAWIFKREDPGTPVLVSCYIEVQEQERLRNLLLGG